MMAAHEEWEELAVGQALGALEPEDEQAFLAHLRGCDICARTLADMEAVAGQLAYGVEPADPPPALLQSIMSEVRSSDRARAKAVRSSRPARRASNEPVSLAQRRRGVAQRSQPAWLVAASFVLVLAMGGWNFMLRADNQAKARALRLRNEVASAVADPSTKSVALVSAKQPTAHAQVLVKGNQAYLVVDGLAENNVANSVYVLWKAGADNHMKGVRGFDVVHDGPNIIPITDLGDASEIKQFAVSIEQGRKIPANPSVEDVVVAGQLA
jgi:anti-sigma factor RsiW